MKGQIENNIGWYLTAFNPYEDYGVKEYLSSNGLSVDKKYRGRGIAEQFLYAREPICQAFGIKLSLIMSSTPYLSKRAENAGYKTISSLQ